MKIKIQRKHIPLLIVSFFGLLMFFIGIYNHYLFKTATWDYGNYNFAFWDYAHFRISPIPTFRGNFLQDHYSFTLMYFVPLYWLLNWLTHTYTLIIIQTSLIIVAAWYSYKIIRLKTDSIWLGAGMLVYYFVLLGRYTTFSCDVNLAVISACFIPIFLYYFKIKKYLVAGIILVLSLFSRENIPLWFIFIFIVLIIEHRKDRKAVIFSIAGIVISLIYFILLFKVLIPSIETPGVRFALFNYSALGATPGEAFLYIIKHPFDTIKLFFVNHLDDPSFDGLKAEFYWVYLVSGGFILFWRPQYFIWFLPVVMQKVLNDAPIRWSIATYYSIEVVTLLPVSVFLVISQIKIKSVRNGLVLIVCLATLSMTIHKMDAKNCRVSWMMKPYKEKFYDKRFYQAPFDISRVNKLLKLIPPTARVSASNSLLPHIAQRQFIYFFPNVADAEYIVFSVFDDHYLHSHKSNEESRNKYLSDAKWEVVASEYPVFLLKYNENPVSDVSVMDRILSNSDTLYCDYERIDTLMGKVLFSNSMEAEYLRSVTDTIGLSGTHSLVLPVRYSYSMPILIADINQIRYMKLSVWAFCGKDEGHIIASCGADYFKVSYDPDSILPSGWQRLIMDFWVPSNIDTTNFYVSLGNNGSTPVFFDDLKIIKYFDNLEQ